MAAAELMTVLKSINESVSMKCRDSILQRLSVKKDTQLMMERALFWTIDHGVQQLVDRLTKSLLSINQHLDAQVMAGLLQEFSVHCGGYNQLKQGVYDQHLVKTGKVEDEFGGDVQGILVEELKEGHKLLDGIYADALSGDFNLNHSVNGQNVHEISMNGNSQQMEDDLSSNNDIPIYETTTSMNTDGNTALKLPKQLNFGETVEIDEIMAMMEQSPSATAQSETQQNSFLGEAVMSDDTTPSMEYKDNIEYGKDTKRDFVMRKIWKRAQDPKAWRALCRFLEDQDVDTDCLEDSEMNQDRNTAHRRGESLDGDDSSQSTSSNVDVNIIDTAADHQSHHSVTPFRRRPKAPPKPPPPPRPKVM